MVVACVWFPVKDTSLLVLLLVLHLSLLLLQLFMLYLQLLIGGQLRRLRLRKNPFRHVRSAAGRRMLEHAVPEKRRIAYHHVFEINIVEHGRVHMNHGVIDIEGQFLIHSG